MYSVLSRLLIAHRQLMKVWDLGPVRQLATQITAEHPWIPCPRSTKQDQIISVSAVSATHYIFHCFTDVCAGTDVFLWSFLFSNFSGCLQDENLQSLGASARQVELSRLHPLRGGSWSPTQQSRESHGILHLTYSMFPDPICVQKQLTKTWDLAHQVPKQNTIAPSSYWAKTGIRSCSSNFLKPSHVISSGGIGPQPDISHCFWPRC